MLKGFSGALTNTHKVSSSIKTGNAHTLLHSNTGKTGVPFHSSTPGTINPTTDNDERAGAGPAMYGVSKGGASGDKSMGYPYQGAGVSELNIKKGY